MVRIEGGTQALRRTIKARLEIEPGTITTVSAPRLFGALILKAAAYTTDSCDRDRHLFDQSALLACIADPFASETTSPAPTALVSPRWRRHCPGRTRPGGNSPNATAPTPRRLCKSFPPRRLRNSSAKYFAAVKTAVSL